MERHDEEPATTEPRQEREQGLDSPLGPRTEDRVEEAPAGAHEPQPAPAEPMPSEQEVHGHQAAPASAPQATEAAPAEPSHPEPLDAQGDGAGALLAAEDADELTRRWESIQIGFVDEPRQAVQDADSLVAEVIRRLSESYSDERSRLEAQWGRGEDVPTDELRLTLRRYRSFFHRLLST